MDAEDRRSVARRAARTGAAVALAAFRGPLAVETKASPSDFVTDADREAQRAVVEVIEEADPGATVVAEEDDAETGDATTAPIDGTAWLVDPIDGTRNYVAGARVWATVVAATGGGDVVAAVTDMPATGDGYALGPEGVTRNGTTVTPSEFDDPETFSVAPLGWWAHEDRAEFGRLCDVLGERFGDLRRLGSAQATLAMVASGELDAAVATRPMEPWDAVAGAAMVERAGGSVTDAAGNPWRPDAGGLVASNGNAHGALLDAVEAVRD